MINVTTCPDAESSESRFSLDAHLELVTNGDVMFVRVDALDHPRLSKGDILVIEARPSPDHVFDDKELLLIDLDGKCILRQKKFVRALLRRAKMHVVGGDVSARIRIIGRVVAWMHYCLLIMYALPTP